MIQEFSLDRVNKADAIFDEDKLEWMNSEYLRLGDDTRLSELVKPFLTEIGIDGAAVEPDMLKTVTALCKVRTRTVKEMATMMQPLLSDKYEVDAAAAAKHLTPEARQLLGQLAERFAALPEFTVPALEDALRKLAEELKAKPAILIHPCRVALTGKTVGPPLFDVIQVLGRERTVKRLYALGLTPKA
jgi:glutamyl/glutaminyl-tRNA synthetase